MSRRFRYRIGDKIRIRGDSWIGPYLIGVIVARYKYEGQVKYVVNVSNPKIQVIDEAEIV